MIIIWYCDHCREENTLTSNLKAKQLGLVIKSVEVQCGEGHKKTVEVE